MLDPELASFIPLMIWFLEENVGMSVRNISEPPLILLFIGTIFLYLPFLGMSANSLLTRENDLQRLVSRCRDVVSVGMCRMCLQRRLCTQDL